MVDKIETANRKTLKEIEWEYCKKDYDYKLRQEAIKWYHRSDGNKYKFILEFFNLTEEEMING